MKFTEWFDLNNPDHLKWFNRYLNTGRVPNRMLEVARCAGVEDVEPDWVAIIERRITGAYVGCITEKQRESLTREYLKFMLTSEYLPKIDLMARVNIEEFVNGNSDWLSFGHYGGKLHGEWLITDNEFARVYHAESKKELARMICEDRGISSISPMTEQERDEEKEVADESDAHFAYAEEMRRLGIPGY